MSKLGKKTYAVEECPDTLYLPPCRIANKTNIAAEAVDSLLFRSLHELDRTNLPLTNVPTEKRIVRFPAFVPKPLTIPCGFIQVPYNGSCFYTCLSWALTGGPGASPAIRKAVHDFVLENHDFCAEIIGSDAVSKYVQLQQNPNEYADVIEVCAIPRIFDVNLFVFDYAVQSWSVFLPEEGLGKRGNIYVRLIDEHYLLVVDVSTFNTNEPIANNNNSCTENSIDDNASLTLHTSSASEDPRDEDSTIKPWDSQDGYVTSVSEETVLEITDEESVKETQSAKEPVGETQSAKESLVLQPDLARPSEETVEESVKETQSAKEPVGETQSAKESSLLQPIEETQEKTMRLQV